MVILVFFLITISTETSLVQKHHQIVQIDMQFDMLICEIMVSAYTSVTVPCVVAMVQINFGPHIDDPV